jgi:CHAP domain-containing protein
VKLFIGPLIAICLFTSAVALVVGATTGAAAREPRPAPARELFAWVPPGGFADRFPFGQCTYWAAYNRRVTWGGNARDWLDNARALGLPTADAPTLGAIAVFWPGGHYSSYGHVAIVTAVGADTYTVSEMNAPVWGRVSTRVIAWPDPEAQGFIPVGGDERGG